MKRLPVRFQKYVLMPMKSTRISKLLNLGEAKIKFDRKLKIHYVQLLRPPSGYEVQDTFLGIDPGSVFDGFSVVSPRYHHLNIELIQRAKKGKNSVKSFKKRQSSNRRVRRSRLWHRKIRFDNRTNHKLIPTIKANIDFRKWLINKLCYYYPICRVVMEDVRFDHFHNKSGHSFSLVEVGKLDLYNWIEDWGMELELYDGWNTKKLRVNSFGIDTKSTDKGSKSFDAHCLDSFVLACKKTVTYDPDTGEIFKDDPIIDYEGIVNKKVTFIEKIVKQRRLLHRVKAKQRDAKKYYHYCKGGQKIYYQNMSNRKSKIRVKVNDYKSNHPKSWAYQNNGYVEKFKQSKVRYGGTTHKGKYKFFQNNEWKNRKFV